MSETKGPGDDRTPRYVAHEPLGQTRPSSSVSTERPDRGGQDPVGSNNAVGRDTINPNATTSGSGGAASGPPSDGQTTAAAQNPPAKGATVQKDAARTLDDPEKDEIRDVVRQLGRMSGAIGKTDPALSRLIGILVRDADRQERRDDPVYRTRVAYAVEDVEKHSTMIPMSTDMRMELGKLSGTYPGLQNSRMRELVAETHTIDERTVVRDIRATAAEISRQVDQATPEATSRLANLENRVRMSPKVPEPDYSNPTVTPGTIQSDPAQGRQQPPPNSANSQNAGQEFQGTVQPRGGRIMLDIMTAIRRPEPDAPAPWDRQLTPMGDRITAYTAKMREGEEEQGFRRAEKSGQVAVGAMKEFSNGPGSVLMARIRDAAKADKDGMAGVMAEMREGGRYAGLRQDFNVALLQEKGFAAAYEKAAGAVERFAGDRIAVDRIAGGRADAAAITGRFLKLDAEVGKAASELPGKPDGKSLTDELAERAGEIIRKAVDAVASAFNRMRPGSGPSPN